jgi:hypothetical protein
MVLAYPRDILWLPKKVGIPIDVHESYQHKRPVGYLVPKQVELVFLRIVSERRTPKSVSRSKTTKQARTLGPTYLCQNVQVLPTDWQVFSMDPSWET